MSGNTHIFPKQDSIVWGVPAIDALASRLDETRKQRAFILTNASLSNSDAVRDIAQALGSRLAGIYDRCAAHSPRESVLEGATAARKAGADVLIAIGGGSVIDAAKLMLPCLWFRLEDGDDISRLHRGDFAEELKQSQELRLIVVPTTLSAAEFTPVAGVTDLATGTKQLFRYPLLVPEFVVLDPEMTRMTPAWLFTSTAIRAIDHCVETFCSSSPTPYADALARGGLRLLGKALKDFRADPDSAEVRLNCQVGSWLAMSGAITGVPTGASHVLGRVLGGAFGVPHAYTSCVLLPGVLKWNQIADEKRQVEVNVALGGEQDADASETVGALVDMFGLPRTLRQLKINHGSFGEIARKALDMFRIPGSDGNARPVKSEADIFEILEIVY